MTRIMITTEVKAPALLDEVAAGTEVQITKHGRIVARLVPASGPPAMRGALGEANALTELGAVRLQIGESVGAARVLEQTLGFYRDLGNRHGEAEVLNHNGTMSLKSGDSEQALAHHQRALDLARAVDSPLEEARALEGTGRCALDRGNTVAAVTELRQALEIYQRIGAAEATQLATDLADLDAE